MEATFSKESKKPLKGKFKRYRPANHLSPLAPRCACGSGAYIVVERSFVLAIVSLSTTILGKGNLRSLIEFMLQLPF